MEPSTYADDDEYEMNRRSKSNENIASPSMISFNNFQLKDSEKIVIGDRSLKSHDLKSNDIMNEDFSDGTNNKKHIESMESDEDSLKYIKLQSSMMEKKLKMKNSLVDSQIKSLKY